jgi:hypothetical protein
MAYSEAKLKSSGDRASPCFGPNLIEKISDKYLPIKILLHVLFKNILISLNSFMGTSDSGEYCTVLASLLNHRLTSFAWTDIKYKCVSHDHKNQDKIIRQHAV